MKPIFTTTGRKRRRVPHRLLRDLTTLTVEAKDADQDGIDELMDMKDALLAGTLRPREAIKRAKALKAVVADDWDWVEMVLSTAAMLIEWEKIERRRPKGLHLRGRRGQQLFITKAVRGDAPSNRPWQLSNGDDVQRRDAPGKTFMMFGHNYQPSIRAAFIDAWKENGPLKVLDIAESLEEAAEWTSLAEAFSYGLRLRPPGPGAVPKGFSALGTSPRFRHGTVSYDRKLTPAEVRKFDLEPLFGQAGKSVALLAAPRSMNIRELTAFAIKVSREFPKMKNDLLAVIKDAKEDVADGDDEKQVATFAHRGIASRLETNESLAEARILSREEVRELGRMRKDIKAGRKKAVEVLTHIDSRWTPAEVASDSMLRASRRFVEGRVVWDSKRLDRVKRGIAVKTAKGDTRYITRSARGDAPLGKPWQLTSGSPRGGEFEPHGHDNHPSLKAAFLSAWDWDGPLEITDISEASLEFDDTYTGPRWTYGLQHRPIGHGTIPDGWIIGSDHKHPEYLHGTIQYPKELAPDKVRSFELELVNVVESLDERSFSTSDIPKEFRLVFSTDKYSEANHGALTSLAKRELHGVTGISDSAHIEISFLGIARDAVLLMPGAETVKLNKLTRVMYENPFYMVSNNAVALRRIFNKGPQDTSRVVEMLLEYVVSALKATGKHHESLRYLTDTAIRQISQSLPGPFKDMKRLVKRLRVALKVASKKSQAASDAAHVLSAWPDAEWYKWLRAAIRLVRFDYGHEGEWMLKGDTLKIPRGSRLRLLSVWQPSDPEYQDYARKADADELRMGYSNYSLEHAHERITLLKKHGILSKYDIEWVRAEGWRQKQAAAQVKYGHANVAARKDWAASFESIDEAMPSSARTTFDSAPYANMRLLDVARLLQGAAKQPKPNVALITKLVDRLVHALEFTIYSIQGRPEGKRIGDMIRQAFNALTSKLPQLAMRERRATLKLTSRLNEAVETLDLGPVEPPTR